MQQRLGRHFYLVLLLCPLVLTTACGKSDVDAKALIHDDAGPLSADEASALASRLRPLAAQKQVNLVVRTSNERVSPVRLAQYLDEVYEKEPTSQVYPRPEVLGRILRSLKSNGMGSAKDETVEIILMTNPSFLGFRYGYDTRSRALISGFMFSPSLLDVQNKAARGDLKGALSDALALIDAKLPTNSELSWYQWFVAANFLYEVHNAIDDITTNHWEAYNKFLLAPALLSGQQWAGRILGWPALASLLVVTVTLAALKTVLDLPEFADSTARRQRVVYGLMVKPAVELTYAIPAIGSLLILSSSRLEDRLFVSNVLQIPLSSVLFHAPEFFLAQSGIWMGALLAILPVANLMASLAWIDPLTRLPDEAQERVREHMGALGEWGLRAVAHTDSASYSGRYGFFSEVANNLPFKFLGMYVGRLAVYSVLPFGAAVYFAMGALTTLAIQGLKYRREYRNAQELAQAVIRPSTTELRKVEYPAASATEG